MMFNSLSFLIFFSIVIFTYYLLKPKYRWILLLISSYLFYMSWKIEYIVLIIISTLVDYFMGLKIYNSKNKKNRKIFLSISLIVNLGLLFIFKYFNFFSSSLNSIFSFFNLNFTPITLKILLPVGISFYTFQTLSYTIDVYKKKIKPEKHLGIFAVYVSFFPQLVAGPIERATNLLPQFNIKKEKEKKIKYENIKEGIILMITGFFKKIVIADNLAVIVNQIYNNPSQFSSVTLIIATIFFSFQIYADFSGYSDIARGVSKTLGYDLMLNFKRPYFSKSIGEFWKRWHISLSTWFKDYLYIPLGGNKLTLKRTLFNLFIVFLISGLWHGANYTFIIWGALNGIYLIIEKISPIIIQKIKTNKTKINKTKINKTKINKTDTKIKTKFRKLEINTKKEENNKNKINTIIKITRTYILTLFSWIFFRSNSIQDSILIIKKIFTTFTLKTLAKETSLLNSYYFYLSIIIILTYSFIEFLFEIKKIKIKKIKHIEIILAIIIFIILVIGNFTTSEFIYFQF